MAWPQTHYNIEMLLLLLRLLLCSRATMHRHAAPQAAGICIRVSMMYISFNQFKFSVNSVLLLNTIVLQFMWITHFHHICMYQSLPICFIHIHMNEKATQTIYMHISMCITMHNDLRKFFIRKRAIEQPKIHRLNKFCLHTHTCEHICIYHNTHPVYIPL